MSEVLMQLRSIRMLAGVPSEDLAPLVRAALRRRVRPGDLIVAEGEHAPPVLLVLDGCVRVYRGSAGGRQQTLARLGAGAAVYLPPAYAEDGSAPATTSAASATELLAIDQADFRTLTSQSPALSRAVMRELSGRLRHFVDLAHDLGLRTVRARLARFLVKHGRQGKPIELSHAEIASSIGSVREVVSRGLGVLEREGLIRIGREHVAIVDMERLQAAADDH